MTDLADAIARAEKAELRVKDLEQQNQNFQEYYGMSREDLVAKLKQIRELVQKDVNKMAEQDKTINNQKEMLSHIRGQLTEVKKELLVSGAKLTGSEFRDALKGYLQDIRAQIVSEQKTQQK